MVNSFCFLFLCFIFGSLAGHAEVVDEPMGCIEKQKYPCAIRMNTHSKIQVNSSDYFGQNKASILFINPSEIQLLEGAFWVSTKKPLVLKNHLTFLKLEGEVWIEKKTDQSLLIRNLSGKVSVQGQNLASKHEIPVGFENWYQGLNSLNQVQQGVLRPIERNKFSHELLQMLSIDKLRAHQASLNYKTQWKESIEDSSELYREVVIRQMASIEEKQNKEEAQRLREEKLKSKMRAMFRERFYFEKQSQDRTQDLP